MGRGAFSFCDNLTEVTLASSVTTIGAHTFEGCRNLISIMIPSTVTTIGKYAFSSCNSLADITYFGTMKQWNDISKGVCWDQETGEYAVYCTEGDVAKPDRGLPM